MAKRLIPDGDDKLVTWFKKWVDAHPEKTGDPFNWQDVRVAAGQELPRRLLPNAEALVDRWWGNKYPDLCETIGVRKYDLKPQANEEKDGDEEEDGNGSVSEAGAIGFRWRQADFNMFFAWSVDMARLARADLERVDARVEEYAELHPELNLNADEVKQQVRQQAGLAA